MGVNQDVSISVSDGSVLSSFKGPSGTLNGHEENYVNYFVTKKSGQHYITVVYISPKYADNPTLESYATVEVCDY